MTLDKLAHLVLPYTLSPNLLGQILHNMTSGRHVSVSKVVDTLDKNLLLLDCEALVLKGVGFPFCLGKTTNASRNSRTRTLILLCCTRIITKLSSLNCGYCSVDPTWFDEFIAHFVLMVMRVLGVLWCGTCFGAGGRLWQFLHAQRNYTADWLWIDQICLYADRY